MSFCSLAAFEGSQVAALASLWVLLAGIQTKFTGFQFADHESPRNFDERVQSEVAQEYGRN